MKLDHRRLLKRKIPFYKTKKFKTALFLITLFMFPMLQYLIFWLYVNVQAIALSFKTFGWQGWVNCGFDNFVEQWNDVFLGKNINMHSALLNSFKVLIANAITLPLAIITAYAFYKKIYFQKFFRVVFYLPSMISVTVLTMCYRFMWANNPSDFVGPIAQFLNLLGINVDWWNINQPSTVIWPLILGYTIWSGLGSNVILICGAMMRIPKEVVEAGRIDGIGFWRELWEVTLPLIMPTVCTFIMTSVMGVFTYTMAPMLLAGFGQTVAEGGINGQAYTIGWAIFNITSGGRNEQLASGAALGTMFSVFSLPVIIMLKIATDKLTPDIKY